ncbi:hypothetical protein ABZ726_29380, partial [Streptomyces hundungensis]
VQTCLFRSSAATLTVRDGEAHWIGTPPVGVLAEEGTVGSVSVEIRVLPTVPGEKRYLINGTQMLTGYYFLRKTRILVDAASIEVLELHSDTLFPATLEGNGARSLERAEFQQAQAWFDSRWETVATPLRPLDEWPGQ